MLRSEFNNPIASILSEIDPLKITIKRNRFNQTQSNAKNERHSITRAHTRIRTHEYAETDCLARKVEIANANAAPGYRAPRANLIGAGLASDPRTSRSRAHCARLERAVRPSLALPSPAPHNDSRSWRGKCRGNDASAPGLPGPVARDFA